MIVSDRSQFVFVHNPKAAGTSIRRRLAAFDDAVPAFWSFAFNFRLRRRIDLAHIPLSDLERAYPATFAKLADYKSFVFVRDPYARAVSAFAEWCVRTRRKGILARPVQARERFRGYVAALDPVRAATHPAWIHACPQHLFAFHQGRQAVGRIGRVESAGADWAELADWIGLDDAKGLDRFNDAGRRRLAGHAPPLAHWYDAVSARRVADFYAADFELFGYPRAAP